MVKSTPINQLQQPKMVQPQPRIVHETEDVNIENLINEQQQQSQEDTNDLQNQINNLRHQLELSKSYDSSTSTNSGPSLPPNPTTATDLTEPVINDNFLMGIMKNFDYKLFFIALILYIIVSSCTVHTFIFDKLELKQLGFLTNYIQSILLALGIVLATKN